MDDEDEVLEGVLCMEGDFTVGFDGEEVPDWSDTFLFCILLVLDAPLYSQLLLPLQLPLSDQIVHSASITC